MTLHLSIQRAFTECLISRQTATVRACNPKIGMQSLPEVTSTLEIENKSNVGGAVLISSRNSRFQPTTAEQSRQQELKAAHASHAVKSRGRTGSLAPSSQAPYLHSPQHKSRDSCRPPLGWVGLPTSTNRTKRIPQRHARRPT